MSALHRNDRAGEYPPSWYAASTDLPAQPRPALQGEVDVDVAILGAGFTGLWAAKTLAEKGYKVAVLEAHRVGWGASGRNGGQVGTGYNRGQRELETRMGRDNARMAWDLAEEAKAQLRDFIALEAPEARYRPGVAHGEYSPSEAADSRADADYLAKNYGYDQIEVLDRTQMQDLVKSPKYVGGLLDRGAGHIHPLRYALGLARAAERAGAVIYETSEVTQIIQDPVAPTFVTAQGRAKARYLILAGNGYLPVLENKVSAHVMPINSFIGATEPLPDLWQQVLSQDIAVADSKFVVNYFRFSEDKRFLFGGRESYSIGFPTDIKGPLQARMVALFPQLKDVKIEHVWGGSLGITMTRLPYLTRVTPNILSGAGYSGHGVALAGIAGKVMAEVVAGDTGRFDALTKLPVPGFPGGSAFRAPLLTLAMTWYGLRDRIGF